MKRWEMFVNCCSICVNTEGVIHTLSVWERVCYKWPVHNYFTDISCVAQKKYIYIPKTVILLAHNFLTQLQVHTMSVNEWDAFLPANTSGIRSSVSCAYNNLFLSLPELSDFLLLPLLLLPLLFHAVFCAEAASTWLQWDNQLYARGNQTFSCCSYLMLWWAEAKGSGVTWHSLCLLSPLIAVYPS